MPKYAQLILGPAGSGKSTYVSAMMKHFEASRVNGHAINLDPAAEHFDYPYIADIRDLIHIDDVMDDEELRFGPNGGLVFAMEYLVENHEWLQELLGEENDEYILFDCPGQIELCSHLGVMKSLIQLLESWNFRVCCVFLLDSQFISDVSKFLSGVLVSLSSMINLEVPTINLLTKTDLLDEHSLKKLENFLEPDSSLLDDDDLASTRWGEKYAKLTEAIGKLIDDYALVKFMSVNVFDEDSLNDVMLCINNVIQFGEDEEVKVKDWDETGDEGMSGGNGGIS